MSPPFLAGGWQVLLLLLLLLLQEGRAKRWARAPSILLLEAVPQGGDVFVCGFVRVTKLRLLRRTTSSRRKAWCIRNIYM